MKSSAILAFVIGSLMLLATFGPTLAFVSPLRASVMDVAGYSNGNHKSYNWCGYAVTGSNVMSVQGSWIVHAVKGTGTKYSAFWVGIDGFSTGTVEQIGTDSDLKKGVPTYYAWYEMYPSEPYMIQIPKATLAIKPGDKISASVSFLGGTSFKVSITDKTTGKSYTNTLSASGAARSSAEWIAEAPSSGSGILHLANFGTVKYGYDNTGITGTCYATVGSKTGSIGSFGTSVQKITMVKQSNPSVNKAVPTALSIDGTSFKVTWKSSGL